MPANGLYDFPKGFGTTNGSSMELIADVSGNRVTAFNVYNCFSSQYDNYKMIGNLTFWGTVGNELAVRLINANGVNSSAIYDLQIIYSSSTGGNFSIFNGMARTFARLIYPNANGIASFQTDIINPALEQRTQLRTDSFGKGTSGTEWSREWDYNVIRSNAQFTGIQMTTSASSLLSGRLSIYGYRNS